jgi:hypothetical protein
MCRLGIVVVRELCDANQDFEDLMWMRFGLASFMQRFLFRHI